MWRKRACKNVSYYECVFILTAAIKRKLHGQLQHSRQVRVCVLCALYIGLCCCCIASGRSPLRTHLPRLAAPLGPA